MNSSGESDAIKVTAKTLKTVLLEEHIHRIDALKIDVEGAEELILEEFFRDVEPSLWPQLLIIDDPPGRVPYAVPALRESGTYRLIGRTRSNSLYERLQNT